MKILFITDLYPVVENEKNTPKTLLNFVNEWKKAGHKVDIIRPNFILNSFIRKKSFYKTGRYGDILNLNYWLPFCGNVQKKLTNFNTYDIVIAHMPSGILFADKLKLPFVAGVHNSDLKVLTHPFYKFYFGKRLKRALDNSKAIACRSFVIKDKLLKLYPEFENKTFVAPSGIDKDIIINRDFDFERKNLRVMTCGNFIKRKNIDKVIEACQGIDVINLTVVGDGDLRKNLEKLDSRVIFTGYLKPEEVYKKMRENDIFILPSVNETFGMVYLEAMASGCITVCTKDDGIAGIIKDGENGFLVEPNINAIKNIILKIKDLDEDAIKCIKINSFNTICEYTSENCANNYMNEILRFCND